jgi:hypothetical protein
MTDKNITLIISGWFCNQTKEKHFPFIKKLAFTSTFRKLEHIFSQVTYKEAIATNFVLEFMISLYPSPPEDTNELKLQMYQYLKTSPLEIPLHQILRTSPITKFPITTLFPQQSILSIEANPNSPKKPVLLKMFFFSPI